MGRILDELKRLIFDQTQKLGSTVGNIYGAAQSPLSALTGAEHSSWLALHVAGKKLTTVESFYASRTAADASITRVIETDDGTIVARYDGLDAVTVLIRGTVELAYQRSFTIAVQLGEQQANFQIVVDGRVYRNGQGAAETGLYLEPGAHTIEILAASSVIGISIPKDLRVTSDFERVPAPIWQGATTGYVDGAQGQSVINLTWFVDARVGGWRILRRQLTNLGPVAAVGQPDQSGEYTITITGVVSLGNATELYVMNDLAGTVVQSNDDGVSTYVRLRLPVNRLTPGGYWVGATANLGSFTELQRIGRTQATGTVTWGDTAVEAGQGYDYALQAWGFVDSNTWSVQSEVLFVRAGDTTPPGSITGPSDSPGAPVVAVTNRRANVRFTTPSDTDYAGVRVYYRQKYTGTADSGTANTITKSGANFATLDNTWSVRINTGTGAGQGRTVVSNTSSTITITPNWLVNPDNTSTYLVYKDTGIFTDYGQPGTQDQFTFEPVDTTPTGPIQEYQFRTFDNTLNEQLDQLAAIWSFDPSTTAGWTSPPLLGIRQVPTTEQVQFAAPYNNTTNYALVELSASDIQGRLTSVNIWYQRRSDVSEIQLPANSPPVTTAEGGTPRQVDVPTGTRSRYVAIERSTDMNWIKVYATDALSNKSDKITYSVDYNDQAEIASLEARLDPNVTFTSSPDYNTISGNPTDGVTGERDAAGIMFIIGAVDDDTRSVRYWLEDGKAVGDAPDPTALTLPKTLDRSTTRSFSLGFTLQDGQRKQLVLEPFNGLGTTGATSLSATATGYARAAGSFVTDGFTVGMILWASGFTNAANNGASIVTAVTALALTVTKAGGTTTEAAGTRTIIAAKGSGFVTTGSVSLSATTSGYARASGSFVTDGFAVGQYVWAAGFTDSTNLGVSLVTAVSALSLTVLKTGGTATEGAAASRVLVGGGGPGQQVIREFSRQARTSATFDSKDETNSVSAKRVRAALQISPTPTTLYSGTAHASASTASTLQVSTGTPWIVNQYATIGRSKYWVIASAVTSHSNPRKLELNGQIRRIVSNTNNTLTVSPDWTTIPTGGTFTILDAAVLFRIDGAGNYVPSSGSQFFDRYDTVPVVFEYYGSKHLCPDEAVKRVLVDEDTVPSFGSTNYSLPSTNVLRFGPISPDDDVKYWRVYRRKGAVPTAAGGTSWPNPLTAADLDPQFLHYGPAEVAVLTYDSYVSTGTYYFAVVPTNALNVDGTPVTATIPIVGASTPALSNLQVTVKDGGGTVNNMISWAHNSDVVTASSKVKVWAERRVYATGVVDIANAELTGVGGGAATRNAQFDSEVGNAFLNSDDGTGTLLYGSFLHGPSPQAAIAARPAQGQIATMYTWKYTVELYDSAGTGLQRSYVVEHTSSYLPPATTVTAAAATVLSQGNGVGSTCRSTPSNNVTWTTSNPVEGSFAIAIEVATDAAGTGPYSLIATGISPNAGAWSHDMTGFYGGAGSARYWKYRVWAYQISNGSSVVSGSKQTTSQLTYLATDCSGGYF